MVKTLEPQVSRHYAALDGLRGWAALSVILYHCVLHYGPDLSQRVMIQPPGSLSTLRDFVAWVVLVAANGEFAVTLFFLLSGMVLAASMARYEGGPIWRFCVGFILRRVFRLMPPLIVAVLASFIVGRLLFALGLADDRWRSLGDLVDNLLLLTFKINGATWTIQVEMIAIPAILLIYLLRRWLGPLALIIVLIAAIHTNHYPAVFGERLLYLANALLAFAVGFCLAEPWARDAFRSRAGWLAWALLAGFVLVRPFSGWGSHIGVTSQILLGGALIGHISNVPSSMTRALEAPLSQFLGKISYSLYLLNVPVIWLAASLLPFRVPHVRALEYGFALCGVVILATVPLAMLAYRYVEVPGMALGRALSLRVSSAGRAAAASRP